MPFGIELKDGCVGGWLACPKGDLCFSILYLAFHEPRTFGEIVESSRLICRLGKGAGG